MIKSKNNIDTGKLIERVQLQQNRTYREIEKAINRQPTSMYQYIRNSSIQTGILIDLCYAMKYNFFQEIANKLPNEFTKSILEDRYLTLIEGSINQLSLKKYNVKFVLSESEVEDLDEEEEDKPSNIKKNYPNLNNVIQ